MSKNTININPGSGSVSIGSVVQGDHNRIDNAVATARTQVAGLAPPGATRAADVAKVTEHLEAFGAEAKRPDRSEDRGAKILRIIRENFSWAYPVITDLTHAIWPALVSLL